jgi:signal transduction histidine kinase
MDLGKVNILIVDDKPDKLLSLEAVLEELGQTIVRAYSGREALRALLNDDFAVILLDVNMPGMDGFETAQLIRQRKSTESVPIIFVTAFGDENHAARGYQLGAVDYIQTPVVSEVLKTKVGVFVELYRKTQQVQRQAEWQRRRAAQLQKLAGASLAINSALSVEKMLQTVTDTARDLVGSHQAITLFILDAATGQRAAKTQSFTSFSEKYAEWRNQPLDLDPIAATVVARSHAASRMTESELRDHPDWEIVSATHLPPIVGGMLAAPLASRTGTSLGVIYLSDRRDGPFTHDDEAIVTQLAQMASVAIENAIFAEERETNRIKDEFLSTLSHELRTPLNAILGWTQLLSVVPLEGEVAHAMEVIERNARAQAKLVEDLLDVSRVTTGKLRLNRRPLQFANVVRAACDAVAPVAEDKELALDCQCVADDDRIHGDADRLQQVVWNLLNNAVKFTPRGGRVDVRLDRIGTNLRLRVSDTGRGIAPTFLPYVFDRFRQADASSTRAHGGLGIGLTIVRHIVELHHGMVHAESAGEGHGATFVVTLPAMASAAVPAVTGGDEPQAVEESNAAVARDNDNGEPAGPPAGMRPGMRPEDGPAPLTSPMRTAADLTGLRIVVVDDEPDARDVISRILSRAGARTTPAASVREALAAVTSDRPDVIVSDIAMPTEDGYDLIRILRELSPTLGPPIPTLALTAYAREEDRARCLSAGFEAYLAKPVDPAELLGVIAHLAAADAGSSGNGNPKPAELKYS